MRKTDMQKTINRSLVALGALAGTAAANAAAVDVTAVTTDIAAQAVPISAVGAAVLVLYVGIKAFKWVRRALS